MKSGKSKVFGVGLGSTLFIFLTIAVLAFVRPVYVRLYNGISKFEEAFCSELEKETGFSVSYRSLSPSLLLGIDIKKISLNDVDSSSGEKKTVVSIKKVHLSYDITKFFSKNPVAAFGTLTLNGVEIEFNAVRDKDVIEKIKNIAQRFKSQNVRQNKDEAVSLEDVSEVSVKNTSFDIPLNIVLKNVSVHYSDKSSDLLASLKKLNLNGFANSESFSVKSSGSVVFFNEALKANGKRQKAAGGFSISGNIFSSLDGSSVLLSIFQNSASDYSLSRLDMLVNYEQKALEIRTMRTALPFSVYAKADFENKTLDLKSEFDRFNPFSLVYVRRKNDFMQKINGSTVSGTFSAFLSAKKLNYDSNLRVNLSDKVLDSPVNVSLAAKGDKNYASISKLAVSADFIDMDFSGGFNIKTMQPSGSLSLNFFRLKNGGMISTEVYVEPERNGFMCFSPQIFFDDMSLTAVQLEVFPENNSVDFAFEFFDYDHADYESAAHFQIDGSLLTGKQNYVQASVSVSDLFIDTVLEKTAFFLDENLSAWLKNISQTASPYVFNTEAYISSDFKDFSINAPVCLLANTKRDRELLIFALDGSKETFNISQFDLQFGGIEAHAVSSVEFADSFKDFSFTSDLTVNSIPYRFAGSVSPEWISVSGDYDFDAMISLGKTISGDVSFRQFPLVAGKYVFALSNDSKFNLDLDGGLSVEISSFEVEEPSLNLPFAPHLVFSGNANRYGFMFSTLAYSDNVSSLDGSGSIVWNLNNGIFDSIHANINVSSYVSQEKFDFSADFTNPSALPFSLNSLKNDFYMSVVSSIDNFPAGRFLTDQTGDDSISAELTATGTINNPLISINLQRARFSLYGYPLSASASLVYDDTGLNVNNMNCSWAVLNVSDLNANFNPFSFNGGAGAALSLDFGNKVIEVPLELRLTGIKETKDFSIPDFFTVELESKEIGGNFFASKFPLKLTAIKSTDRIDITADNSSVFNASLKTNGEVSVHTDSPTVKFDLSGSVVQNVLDFEIKGIFADMKKISSEIEIPAVHFNEGFLHGALKIGGLTTDPEFTGAFSVEKLNLNIPYLSKYAFSTPGIFMTVGQGEARVEPTVIKVGKGQGSVEMIMEFNRWGIDTIDVIADVDDSHKVPLEMSFPFIFVKGDGSCNLDILYTFPNDISISGWITGDNTDVEIVASSLQKQFSLENISQSVPVKASESSSINVFTDLDITVGQKVQVLFTPLLRGVVSPGTALSFFMDSATGEFEVKSDVSLRGGEVAWLNRNFYMKEGQLSLNETQDRIDPRITVRAETRERDETGNMITITMTANNEPLSTFSPHFTATPAKSEKEIMELLGEVVSADSDNIASLAVAGGDYFLQSTLMRSIENTLRETLNFDIFSIRTNVLQNSVKYTMNRETSHNKQLSFGNFIDNSTVYVGKYFGSSIYVDSLLHWSYDENTASDGSISSDIVFQPEFGFEMTSPFVNIRIGVAPDIDEIRRGMTGTWVPSTSMTLSWKHSF